MTKYTRSRKSKRTTKPSLTQTESMMLFALSAFPAVPRCADEWAKLVADDAQSQGFTRAVGRLAQKGLIREIEDDNGVSRYKIVKNTAQPNFFIAKISSEINETDEKFIRLEPQNGVEHLNFNFIIPSKDFHKFDFSPGQMGVFRFPKFKRADPKAAAGQATHKNSATIDNVPDVCPDVCVEPYFSFTKKRDACYVIGNAIRGDKNKICIAGGELTATLAVSAGKSKHLKHDCLYRIKVTPDFSPFKPCATLAKGQEIYNPHAQENDFSHLMKRFDLSRDHDKKINDLAAKTQKQAGPFIASSANDNKFIISIDQPGTQCIDDAFSLLKHSNGYTQETYLIAVPLFFDINSDLYKASLDKGQSLYAGKRTVSSTIPSVLSHGKASLHEGQDCPVVVVRTEYDLNGRIIEQDFKDSFRKDFIRVTRNISDRQFNAGIQAGDPKFTVYKEFMDARRDTLRHKKTQPLHSLFNQCSDVGIIDSNIVADRMLNANALAGRFLHEKGIAAGFRNFGLSASPSYYDHTRYKLGLISSVYADILPVSGAEFSSSHLKTLLDASAKAGHLDIVSALIKERSLDQSQYNAVNRGHTDIGIDAYATISSAARRHVDYVNQSLILSELGHTIAGVEYLYHPEKMQKICDHLNDVQIRHDTLFQASKQRHNRAIMHELSVRVEPAVITNMSGSSLLVKYENYNVSEYFNAQALAVSGFEIDSVNQELVLPSYYSGKPAERYAMGCRVNIQIDKETGIDQGPSAFKVKILPR